MSKAINRNIIDKLCTFGLRGEELELAWRKRRRKKRKPIPKVLFAVNQFGGEGPNMDRYTLKVFVKAFNDGAFHYGVDLEDCLFDNEPDALAYREERTKC